MPLGYEQFRCPQCIHEGKLGRLHIESEILTCTECGQNYTCQQGVWKFLSPVSSLELAGFVSDYETIRRGEGKESLGADYYNALPYLSPGQHQYEIWRIRAKSYEALLAQVVIPARMRQALRLRVLDLGAGNGWLSHLLGDDSTDCVALDVVDNDWDGLGAAHNFTSSFLKVQASFDELPFAAGSFDLIVFNASFHYSKSYHATLKEALRVLDASGKLIIMDSPVYHSQEAGAQMAVEKHDQFESRFGVRSESIICEEFLTHDRLDRLAGDLGLVWDKWEPFYHWKWRLRPLKAKLRRRRELARFFLITGSIRN
jgi:SAM-dependent methyltransferase